MTILTISLLVACVAFAERSAAQKTEVTIRVLLVIEQSLYNRWLTFSESNATKADAAISYFYSDVFSKARSQMKTESTSNVEFDLVYSDSLVDKTGSELSFIPGQLYGNVLVFTQTLKSFRDYLNTKSGCLSPHDVAILFTSHSLMIPNLKSFSVETFRYALTTAAVVVEDGLYCTVNSVVSEIAKSFRNDVNTCSGRFIQPPGDNGLAKVHGCLKSEMEAFIPRLAVSSAGFVGFYVPSPSCYKLDVLPSSIQPSLSADKQCQLLYGPESTKCDIAGKTVCLALGCMKDGQCKHHADGKAFEGTECGGGQICQATQCVSIQEQ